MRWSPSLSSIQTPDQLMAWPHSQSQGLDPSQWWVAPVLPHHLCPGTVTSPTLPWGPGGLSGGLQFTLLYLCLGINCSQSSTNPYLCCPNLRARCFYPCFTCFPSPMYGPALVDSPCHCLSTFSCSTASLPCIALTNIYATFLHLQDVSRMFSWSIPSVSSETCTCLGSIGRFCGHEYTMGILAHLPSWWILFLRMGLNMIQLCIPYRAWALCLAQPKHHKCWSGCLKVTLLII